MPACPSLRKSKESSSYCMRYLYMTIKGIGICVNFMPDICPSIHSSNHFSFSLFFDAKCVQTSRQEAALQVSLCRYIRAAARVKVASRALDAMPVPVCIPYRSGKNSLECFELYIAERSHMTQAMQVSVNISKS